MKLYLRAKINQSYDLNDTYLSTCAYQREWWDKVQLQAVKYVTLPGIIQC